MTTYDAWLLAPLDAREAAQDAYEAECAAVQDYRRDADSLDASCPIEADEPTESDWQDFDAWAATLRFCPCGTVYSLQTGDETMCPDCGDRLMEMYAEEQQYEREQWMRAECAGDWVND